MADEGDTTTTELRRIVNALAGLEAGTTLDGAAGRILASLSASAAAEMLAELMARPPTSSRETKALFALCRALHFGAPALTADDREAIRRAALSIGLGEVVALFTDAQARLTVDEATLDAGARRSGAAEKNTAATLGARTQAARTERRPERLLRLCADPHPAVIRNLLLNPRLTEAHVLRIASRRPVDSQVLEEVGHAVRFCHRPAVRRAIALNPYAAPGLAVSLLAGLTRADLDEVAQSRTLHDYVREAATALLAARAEEG